MNLKNLTLLRDYLKENQDAIRLDMHSYVRHRDHEFGSANTNIEGVDPFACGTTACIVGHAALSGIPKLAMDHKYFGWHGYVFRVFDIRLSRRRDGDLVFNYLFSWRWAEVDNTLASAIERLTYFIDHKGKVPPSFKGFDL